MPRQSRIDITGALHHIIIRGIERKRVFRNNRDRDDFLDRLGNIIEETKTQCYAWALIPNHAHFLLRTGEVPIATVMSKLLTGYAVSFNLRHHRHGKLFQNRYKSILCQEDPYFLQLISYIHLNPLRAGIVQDYQVLNRHKYTGQSVILGYRKNQWQEVDTVLRYFGKRKRIARDRYKLYVRERIKEGRRSDLIGGGLIRSLGGWEEVKKLRKKDRVKGDERILGDSEFVLAVLKTAEEKMMRSSQLSFKGYNLKKLCKKVSDIFQIKPNEIMKPGRYNNRVQARSVLCYYAVNDLGVTITELARQINISPQAVSLSVKRGELIIKNKNLKLLD